MRDSLKYTQSVSNIKTHRHHGDQDIVNKSANSIEINGKRYDAQTGKPFIRAHSVDGVIGSHKTTVPIAAPTVRIPKPLTPLSAGKLMDMQPPKRAARSAASPAAGHKPQTSATLMRHVVHKPGKSLKRNHTAVGHIDAALAKPVLSVIPAKNSVASVPASRLARAERTKKHERVSRFSTHLVTSGAAIAQAVSSAVPTAKELCPKDVFEQALEHATSHLQPPVNPVKHPARQKFLARKRVSAVATGLVLLLLAGGIGYFSRTNLALHMAANKAGFSATLPSYNPAGFRVGALKSSAGAVAIQYKSNSDQRAFAITEKPSNWDSSTLRDNFVSAADKQYQVIEVGGRTVYLYGQHNAAWVNGGIWYQVESNGALSDQQLSHLASSL